LAEDNVTKRTSQTATSQARLAAVIKSARDTMRKDPGLSGDLDRLPQLSWLIFLKAFDALEDERMLRDPSYQPALPDPCRWRVWARSTMDGGATGGGLLAFINDDLLPRLRRLRGRGSGDARDTIASIFRETYNRMRSGYLLREVIDQLNKIDFHSSDDIHTMAFLYESMLREMRDAAGDSGEFYTPRPVIRFMVQQIDPNPEDIVLDPACGTGGFLVETLAYYEHKIRTAERRKQALHNLRGVEKKPLPFLLGTMNLLLHGVEEPRITSGNALARPPKDIGPRDRVDVILTNPPFGGEEEKGIQAGFPAATRTAETAWLFLQVVQRSLKSGGRCSIVVPNNVLFAEGLGARIKAELLRTSDLHTVVRLPNGVFSPYTLIPTNLLFFVKDRPTKAVWFYELRLPEGRRSYTKTRPLQFEEFADCQAWWGGPERKDRVENDYAWRVPIADLEADGWNLDRRNPNRSGAQAHRPPEELLAELVDAQGEILDMLRALQTNFGGRR
jgi:type I restriction enzyme M protein